MSMLMSYGMQTRVVVNSLPLRLAYCKPAAGPSHALTSCITSRHISSAFKARCVAQRRRLCTVGAAAVETATPAAASGSSQVRVRFAPSPTGNLHVGGARTALFNYLYAQRMGGTMVLRIEDTDAARSTKESEEAVLRDLTWLGIQWDEGPDVGGPHGPYRQSERKDLYKQYVDQLVQEGKAYPCFCTDEELEQMKAEAAEKKLPPIYRGKWATASAEEVEEMMKAGVPYCYRFRVPKDTIITINDVIRDEVSWNTDTLGDFVLLRSNGLPVYNFCVAIDDALMKITHVIRAEEHLPNTLRQVLIYQALGFPTPTFGHVSLILAPDKSKLSKRHGATSVGEFRQEGFLPEAMINFLSLLGWNDGTEQEIYTRHELTDRFSLERITKSGAVFDKTKLGWMNGQHLRNLPDEELVPMLGEAWVASGTLSKPTSPFVHAAAALFKQNLELVADADKELRAVLSYPLEETLASEACAGVVEDDFAQVASTVVDAWKDGSLQQAVQEGGAEGFKAWVKGVGKAQKRKGKRLFMPLRVAITGRMAGPDVGDILELLSKDEGDLVAGEAYVPLDARMQRLEKAMSTLPAAKEA